MVHLIFKENDPDLIYKICEALSGWQPYIDSEVCVYDHDEEGNSGIIIGPDKKGEDVELLISVEKES